MEARYREPVDVPDGVYVGRQSGYRLSWEFGGREVDVITSIGIRGMNVPTRFALKDGKVLQESIERIDRSEPDGETIGERLDHLERLCDTISDEVNWVRARDQIRAIRQWVKSH